MVMIDSWVEKKPLGVISVTQLTTASVDGVFEGAQPDEITP
jgi:hypothetical protein